MLRTRKNRGAVLFLLACWAVELTAALPDANLPADPAYWTGQAEERLKAGDREGALKLFQRASWEAPQAPLLHYNMGSLSESLGRADEAIEHYEAYLRWAPRALDREVVRGRIFGLYGRVGSLAYEKQEYRQAQRCFERARSLYPRSRSVHFNLGRVYEALGDWETALSVFKEYASSCSDEERESIRRILSRLLVQGGRKLQLDGDETGALANFEEAYRWDPGDSRILLYRAQCEDRLGLPGKARRHYMDYLETLSIGDEKGEIQRRIAQLSSDLAEPHLRRGDLATARMILSEALEVSPQDARLLGLMAEVRVGTGQTELAIVHLEKALAADPGSPNRAFYEQQIVQSCMTLADQAFQLRDYPKALSHLDKAVRWRPRQPAILYNLARVQEALNRFDEAVSSYRLCLDLAPEVREREEIQRKIAYLNGLLGAELYRKGNYAGAQEAFEQALLMNSQEPALLYNLAVVLLKRQKPQLALELLERYVTQEKEPKEAERASELLAYVRKANQEQTVRSRREAVLAALSDQKGSGAGEPGPILQRQTALFLKRTGRWQEALDQYEAHVARFPESMREDALQKEIAAVHREIGRSAVQEGNPSGAMRALDRSIEWSPGEGETHRLKGWVFENAGDHEEALAAYQAALRLVVDSRDRLEIRRKITGILTGELESCLKGQDLPGALKALNRLEPYLAEEERPDWNYQRARIESALGRPRQALLHYALFLLDSPQAAGLPAIREELASQVAPYPDLVSALHDPGTASRRARQAYERREHERALFCLAVAGLQGMQEPDRDAEIVRNLEAMGRSHVALSYLTGKPENVSSVPAGSRSSLLESVQKEVLAAFGSGLYEEGLARIGRMETLAGGTSGEFSLLRAAFLQRLGKFPDAILYYEDALRSRAQVVGLLDVPLEDRLAQILTEEALERYRKGAYLDCLHMLERARTLAPRRADVAFNEGCTHLRLRQYPEALQALSRFLDLVQDSPRRELTRKAVETLKDRIGRRGSVGFDPEGFSVTLVAEIPQSVSRILASDRSFNMVPLDMETLDQVLLAPFVERTNPREETLQKRRDLSSRMPAGE